MMNNEEKILSLLMEMKEEFNVRFEGVEKELSNLKEQLAENTSILRAVEHRGEVTSAELQGFKLEMCKELGAIKADLKEVKEDLKDIPTIKKILMAHEWILQKEGLK